MFINSVVCRPHFSFSVIFFCRLSRPWIKVNHVTKAAIPNCDCRCTILDRNRRESWQTRFEAQVVLNISETRLQRSWHTSVALLKSKAVFLPVTSNSCAGWAESPRLFPLGEECVQITTGGQRCPRRFPAHGRLQREATVRMHAAPFKTPPALLNVFFRDGGHCAFN